MRRGLVVLLILATGCGGHGPAKNTPVALIVTPVDAAHAAALAAPPPKSEPKEPPLEIALAFGQLCARDEGRVYCSKMTHPDEPLLAFANAETGIEDATSIACGQSFFCVTTRRGTVECTGDNTFGELGAQLSTPRSESYVTVTGVSHARRVFAGAFHACAVLDDDSVRCWGRNESGQTGSETTYVAEARSLVFASDVPNIQATQLALAFSSTCARLTTGEVSCWGARKRPALVANLDGVSEIASGESGYCAIQHGKVVCFGDARQWVPGANSGSDMSAPAEMPGIKNASHLAITSDHGCAVLDDGRVACFGMAYSASALGRDPKENTGYEPLPAEVVAKAPRASAVTVSSGLTCILGRDSEVYCWGRQYRSDGTTEENPTPTRYRLR